MIETLIEAKVKDLGGFSVGRVLPQIARRAVGPFVFLDHMGPATFAPGHGIDVRPHPHIGLSTLSYLFEGRIEHADSLGVQQTIEPGAVNWMTAGRGIVHSERTHGDDRATGWRLDGMQAWIALPDKDLETDPSFDHHPADTLPVLAGEGWTGRLIAGTGFGAGSPVRVHSPLVYAHLELDPGASVAIPADQPERAIYVARGAASVGDEPVGSMMLAVLREGDEAVVRAGPQGARVMVLGGAPVGPRILWWNFVAADKDRLEQAKADWRDGRMALPPGESEFIPLPD
jgi:redox-sensitive bicupin YhaK (pirin superfamily)